MLIKQSIITNKFKIASVFFLLSILLSCDEYELARTNTHDPKSPDFKPSLAELTTTAVSAITSNSATLGGNITFDGSASITVRGVCWGTKAGPTIDLETKTQNGTGAGTFISGLTGLTPTTFYYARAYATNAAGTAYGNTVTFSTLVKIIAPVLTTTEATFIGVTTAKSGGNITSDGGSPVTSVGFAGAQPPIRQLN